MKREWYISRDEYFMGIALLSAHRSKDPSTQVGACIVNPKKRIVGIGYNGFPAGCSDEEFPWESDGNFLEKKNTYVVHAEANAILNAHGNLDGCAIYIVFFPCHECTKLIIQSGIKKVVYLSNTFKWGPDVYNASRKMLEHAGVEIEQFVSKQPEITINFQK